MKQETILKIEETRQLSTETAVPGVALVGIGLFLLVANIMGIPMMDIFWPIFVIFPGLLLLWPAYKATAGNPSRLAFLAVPGAMVLTVGSLLFAMNLTGYFAAWAYSWPLVVAAAAAGLMYLRRFDPTHAIHTSGRNFMRVMFFLFLGLAIFFEFLVFENLQPWLPLALIGYGLYTLIQARQAKAV